MNVFKIDSAMWSLPRNYSGLNNNSSSSSNNSSSSDEGDPVARAQSAQLVHDADRLLRRRTDFPGPERVVIPEFRSILEAIIEQPELEIHQNATLATVLDRYAYWRDDEIIDVRADFRYQERRQVELGTEISLEDQHGRDWLEGRDRARRRERTIEAQQVSEYREIRDPNDAPSTRTRRNRRVHW